RRVPGPSAAAAAEAWLPARTGGLEAAIGEHLRLRGREPDVFHRAWVDSQIEDPGPPEKAFTFQRAGGAPVLRLDVRAPTPAGRCRHDVTWRGGPRQAELRAAGRLTAAPAGLLLVQWGIPPPGGLTPRP